jgi:hypothetical protein
MIRSFSAARTAAAIAVLVSVTGCAGAFTPVYDASIRAERQSGAAPATSFAIADGTDAKVASAVRTALVRAGLQSAAADRADVIVAAEYLVAGQRQVPYPTTEPVYSTYRTRSYVTQRQVGTTKEGRPIYTPVTAGGEVVQQYVGERRVCVSTTVTDKTMRLTAVRRADSSTVWTTSVRVSDNGTDDARYIAVLAEAAAQFVDRDSVETTATLTKGGRKAVPGDSAQRAAGASAASCRYHSGAYSAMPLGYGPSVRVPPTVLQEFPWSRFQMFDAIRWYWLY